MSTSAEGRRVGGSTLQLLFELERGTALPSAPRQEDGECGNTNGLKEASCSFTD